jgi:hypothetical protein
MTVDRWTDNGVPAAVTVSWSRCPVAWASDAVAARQLRAPIRNEIEQVLMPITLRRRSPPVADFSADRANGSVSGRKRVLDLAPP